jgi:hypothetical protein
MRQHSIDGMGGRPRWRSVTARVCPAGILPAGPILEGTLPGPVRSQGVGRTMRDLHLTVRAQHAALRLEPYENNGPRSFSQRSFSRPQSRCQVTEQLASWPHGVPSAADQPPAGT